MDIDAIREILRQGYMSPDGTIWYVSPDNYQVLQGHGPIRYTRCWCPDDQIRELRMNDPNLQLPEGF